MQFIRCFLFIIGLALVIFCLTILYKYAPILFIIFIFLLIKVTYDLILESNNSNKKQKEEAEKQREEAEKHQLEITKKAKKIAIKYVEQYILGHCPKYKNFSKEEISIFEEILKESLTDVENMHLKNIEISSILYNSYNEKAYYMFKKQFELENNLTSEDDFINYIIAYLDTFDQNVEWLYYFCRLIQENNVKLITTRNMKKYSREFRQKIISFHSKIAEIVQYFEKSQTDTFTSTQEFSTSYTKEFFEIAHEIIQIFQFEQKVKIAKTNMETGQKAISNFVSINNVDGLDGFAFEYLLGALFKQMNYKVEVTRGSGDQGADIIISKMGRKTVVQAKCYLNNVSNKAIQEVVAAIKYYNADAGMVVTNSYYTKGAKELAEANDIALWDRDKLSQMLSAYPVVLDEI